MAEQLSPAAQAVLDAYRSSHLSINNLAAALEALADQVVPNDGVASSIERIVEKRIHAKLLAIAAELRGQDQPTRGSDFNG